MRVILRAYTDRSFKFIVKPPPSSWFIKKATSLAKCTDKPGQNNIGRVGVKYLYEIAKVKQEVDPDLKTHDIEGIMK